MDEHKVTTIDELNKRIEHLEDRNRQNKKLINVLNQEIRYLSDRYMDTITRFNELTLPTIRNLISSDRQKVGEYFYGKTLY